MLELSHGAEWLNQWLLSWCAPLGGRDHYGVCSSACCCSLAYSVLALFYIYFEAQGLRRIPVPPGAPTVWAHGVCCSR